MAKQTIKSESANAALGEESGGDGAGHSSKFPRHALDKALRIPRAILEQNAGQDVTDKDAAKYANLGFNGPTRVEISSAIKFGLLKRPSAGKVALTTNARRILRPQQPDDALEGMRAAALAAPGIAEVYQHYRGENLPDAQFLQNALVDKFGIPSDKVTEFLPILTETLKSAHLIEEHDGKIRLLDISHSADTISDNKGTLKKLGKTADISDGDICFMIMPFSQPYGSYYSQIYQKAIEKVGLRPVRADAELFGTGKIIDQVWRGLNDAKVLVAELTTRNANVFYELGLAHALGKPVVLVSATEQDVPFDLRHIRVIYYDITDPFWGQKLLDKVAENILSALNNPEEALFKNALAKN